MLTFPLAIRFSVEDHPLLHSGRQTQQQGGVSFKLCVPHETTELKLEFQLEVI